MLHINTSWILVIFVTHSQYPSLKLYNLQTSFQVNPLGSIILWVLGTLAVFQNEPSLVSQPWEFPGEIRNWPHTQRVRKEETTPDWQGAALISMGTNTLGLCWWLQDEEISTSAARILRGRTEALTGFSHTFSPGGLNSLISQGFILENSSAVRKTGRTFQRWRRDEKPLLPGSL